MCLAARLLLRGPPLDAAGLDAWESAAWHTRQLGTVANDLGAGAILGIGCRVCATSRDLPDTHGGALPGTGSSMHAGSECQLASMAQDGAVTCLSSRQCSAGLARAVLRTILQACSPPGLCIHSVVSVADAEGGRAVSGRPLFLMLGVLP